MSSSDQMPDTNGHDTPNNKTENFRNPPLTQQILQHLQCNGYRHAATALQAELGQKTSTTTTSVDQTNVSSSLQRMYDQFQNQTTHHTHARARRNVSDEMVMTASDLSLQSFGEYQQIFTHSNRCAIHCISFSNDGAFVAFGGADGSIRVFDVNKLHQCSEGFNSLIKKYDFHSYSDIHRPLIATLTAGFMPSMTPSHQQQHQHPIHEIDFHPHSHASTPHICSCYNGGLLFHEFVNSQGVRTKPIDSVEECFKVRTAQYHPSGQFVLCGGDASYVRLYDIEREQGYIAQRNHDADHSIAQVRWSATGNMFAACTDRGDIRLYDGRSMSVVNTLRRVHGGAPITGIRFNKDCRYLLSAGGDEQARLWDMRTGGQCMSYRGGGEPKSNRNSGNSKQMCACFTYNDEHIVTFSSASAKLFVYDSNTGSRIHRFKQHISSSDANSAASPAVTALCTSPVERAFMCASSDHKYRFFATIKQIQSQYHDANRNQTVSQANNVD